MNATVARVAPDARTLPTTPLGHTLHVWTKLQNGQQEIIRFGLHTNKLGHRIRWQNGYDHLCSVTFLCSDILVRLRRFVNLDELLVTRCFQLHDIPEGFLHRDIIAPLKKDSDDVAEYLAFRSHFEPLGPEVWSEMQRCFLLQFALQDHTPFPTEAHSVLADLKANKTNEALAFDGIQRIDYLFYAEECAEVGASTVLEDVATNQVPKLDAIATQLPGFKEVVWTGKRRDYFLKYARL